MNPSPGPQPMRRFPWVSVALLIVLGLLAALTFPTLDAPSDEARSEAGGKVDGAYAIVGWAAAGLALVTGALGVWARAPATLPTALGIVGAGAFAAAWLAQAVAAGDLPTFRLGMVVAFSGIFLAFATSARRVAVPDT
jgi:hypothetical protein